MHRAMHHRLPVVVCMLLACVVLLSACAAPRGVDRPGHIADLDTIPQSAFAFVQPGSGEQRLLPVYAQLDAFNDFLDAHYAPWSADATPPLLEDLQTPLRRYGSMHFRGQNLLRHPPALAGRLQHIADLKQWPRHGQERVRALITQPTPLLGAPTTIPAFKDAALPGEGYPFDYNLRSLLRPGEPVRVWHTSSDGAFRYVSCRFASGWVAARHLARVDDELAEAWRRADYATFVDDDVLLHDAESGEFVAWGRIGMVLPLVESAKASEEAGSQGSDMPDTHTLLLPVRDVQGTAQLVRVHANADRTAVAPLAFTPSYAARLLNGLLGRPYGWGGLGGERDCSAALMDYFAAFGVAVPRNSAAQSRAGERLDVSGVAPQDKPALLQQWGVAWRTIVHRPGHVMLYVGGQHTAEGVRPVVFHVPWGIVTGDGDRQGRHIVGRAVLTTLTPGAELGHLHPQRGDWLQAIDTYTTVNSN